jgi:hypothetical protein
VVTVTAQPPTAVLPNPPTRIHGKVLNKTSQDKTRQDMTRQDKTRQDKTRQDKSTQAKPRQRNTTARQDNRNTRRGPEQTRQDNRQTRRGFCFSSSQNARQIPAILLSGLFLPRLASSYLFWSFSGLFLVFFLPQLVFFFGGSSCVFAVLSCLLALLCPCVTCSYLIVSC